MIPVANLSQTPAGDVRRRRIDDQPDRAAIGISNIMLVTVTERTREIGGRRALVGVSAGFLPALKAARLDIIDALRHE